MASKYLSAAHQALLQLASTVPKLRLSQQSCQTRCFQQAYVRRETWEAARLKIRRNSMEKIRHSLLGTNAKCHTWAEVISWQIRDGEWLSRQPYPRKGSGGLLCGSQLNVSQRDAAARGTDSTVGATGMHGAWRAHRKVLLLCLIQLLCPVLDRA